MSDMVFTLEARKIGEIIQKLDLSQTVEEIGYEFLSRLPGASTLSRL